MKSGTLTLKEDGNLEVVSSLVKVFYFLYIPGRGKIRERRQKAGDL